MTRITGRWYAEIFRKNRTRIFNLNGMNEKVMVMTPGDPQKEEVSLLHSTFIGRKQTLDASYVVGLVDGEGSFNVRVNRQRRRARVELKFSLKLRHQDKDMLDSLQHFFGCGKVYIQRDKRENHSLCYRFEVQNKKQIVEHIIPFFDKNPPKIPSRYRDFELFRQIAELSLKEPIDLEKIGQLKKEMHWGLAAYGKTVRAVETRSN